jgi:hypothetical protein
MRARRRLLAAALLLAAAPAPDPARPVTTLYEGVLAAAAWPPDRARLAGIVRASFDLPAIAAAVLGATHATPGQRDRLAVRCGC